jgi:hypothetical protein
MSGVQTVSSEGLGTSVPNVMPPRLLAALRDTALGQIQRIGVSRRTVALSLATKCSKLYDPHVRYDGGIFHVWVFDTRKYDVQVGLVDIPTSTAS